MQWNEHQPYGRRVASASHAALTTLGVGTLAAILSRTESAAPLEP
jgi:hypothetical protein